MVVATHCGNAAAGEQLVSHLMLCMHIHACSCHSCMCDVCNTLMGQCRSWAGGGGGVGDCRGGTLLAGRAVLTL
jgi:hypothetical protein